MRILVVDDDDNIARGLLEGLKKQGYAAERAVRAEDGLWMAREFPFDAMILDVQLPDFDGFTLLERLRKSGSELPVLMLTTLGEIHNRVKGLDLGADDYLPKPFAMEELSARLLALIRRSNRQSQSELQIHDLVLDLKGHQARRGPRELGLTDREYRLLEFMALHAGEILSRQKLMDHLYGIDEEPESNILDVYVAQLRRKLEKGGEARLIQTIRGAGYRLSDPVS